MRDQSIFQASSSAGVFVFPKLRRVIRSWLAKRKLRRLEQFDDYMLNDIGISRDDLHYALRLPSSADPITEMTRLREQRIRRGVRTN